MAENDLTELNTMYIIFFLKKNSVESHAYIKREQMLQANLLMNS
jgi:hypothetical protein